MHLYFNGPFSAFRAVADVFPNGEPPNFSQSGSSAEAEIRMREVQFGDGYSQRSPDGINNLPLKFSITFNNRPREEILEIQKFFRGGTRLYPREGHEYFYLYPPSPVDWGDDTRPLKVICRSWRITPGEAQLATMSAEMEQVFDP